MDNDTDHDDDDDDDNDADEVFGYRSDEQNWQKRLFIGRHG